MPVAHHDVAAPPQPPVRLGYVVSHAIQYQAPLLRQIAQEPGLDLTVLFGSDFSTRGYRDQGFGVDVAWDVPLLGGYRHEFLKPLRDTGSVSATAPISRRMLRALRNPDGTPRFDALWVHGYASVNSLQAILAAKALGIPVLLRAESWLGDRERSGHTLLAKKLFLRTLASAVDAVLPIGSHNAAYWTEYLPEVRQFSVPYAVDNAYFARLAEQARPRLLSLRSEFNLSPDQPVVLFASKLIPRKNAGDLLQAFSLFRRELPATGTSPCLLLAGDGEERTALEAEAARLGLADSVRFIGFRNQSELPALFALASVFVLPSRHEPWGLIVNEAMAAGCPVIVSDEVGAAADLVADGVEGVVFPAGDVSALARALARVFATPGSARAMGQAAQARMITWSFAEDIAGLRAALTHVTRRRLPS